MKTRLPWILSILLALALAVVTILSMTPEPAAKAPARRPAAKPARQSAVPAAVLPPMAVPDPAAPSPQLVTVQTVVAESMPVSGTFTIPGIVTVDAGRLRDVTATFGGAVQKVYVNRPGTLVHRGDTLLLLDSPDFAGAQQEYMVAYRAKVASPSKLERTYRRLLDAGFADADIRNLEKTGVFRRNASVLAPADGTVIGRLPAAGTTVAAGTIVAQVGDVSRVQILAEVGDEELHAFTTQAPVKVTAAGRTFNAKIASVAPPTEPQSRVGTVRLDVENREGILVSGMSADISVNEASKTVTLVPEAAVLVKEKQSMVFVVSAAGSLELREVETGVRTDRGIEIRRGVAPGEKVMILENSAVDPAALMPAVDPPPGGGTEH